MDPSHQSTRDRLRRVPLFAELEEEDLDRLTGLSRVLHLRKKEMLFNEYEPYRGMFIILEGLAVVYKLSDEGRMLILHVCRAGGTVAEASLFDEDPEARYAAYACCTRDSEVLFLPKEKFAPFLKRHPEVAWEMLKSFAARMRELSQQLEGVTLREVTSRLARYLLNEMAAAGLDEQVRPVLELTLAKNSLASFLGTVQETLSRTFARLTKENVIAVDGSKITILDPTRLRRLA